MPLPVHPEHAFPGEVSYSELALLASCEEKWRYVYAEKLEHETSQKMMLGTILGVVADAYWQGRSIAQAFEKLEHGETRVDEKTWDDAHWLMHRYVLHYDDQVKPKLVQNEVELRANLMGVTLVAHLDQLWETPSGKRWLVERKSTGKLNQTADFQLVSPQHSLYKWIAEENGIDIYGVVSDLIYTYHWKRDEHKHPTSDTCKMLFIDRTEDQVSGALVWARKLIDRRKHLLRVPADATLNLSALTCNRCVAHDECWDRLSFPRDNVTVVDDDD